MTIKISNILTENSGKDGLHVEGDIDLEIENIHTRNSGGSGVSIHKQTSILEQFGLPADTNPTELANLLISLRKEPSDQHEEIVKKSSLYGKFSTGVQSTAQFIANLSTIASSPQAQTLISKLLS